MDEKQSFTRQSVPMDQLQGSNRQPIPVDQLVEDLCLVAKKIELPYFKGEDPFGQVSRTEAYFAIQGTPPMLQLEFAHISMEGPPWHQFKMLKEEDPYLDWEKFKWAFFD